MEIIILIVLVILLLFMINNRQQTEQYMVKQTPVFGANTGMSELDSSQIDSHYQQLPVDSKRLHVADASEIDNSDIVEQALNKNPTVYNSGQYSPSATSTEQLKGFTLGEPDSINYAGLSNITNGKAYTADEAMARKQMHRGAHNKKTIDGVVRNTKNMYKRLYTGELENNEKREWWSADATDFETDFYTYY